MKIDRLIGIIATLQQNEKVTAPFLAEKLCLVEKIGFLVEVFLP